jgi:hypothetical protein
MNGGGWQYTMLLAFIGNGARGYGAYPDFGLISAGSGNLYGTTAAGGGDSGNVFRMKLNLLNGSIALSVLHFFQGGAQGSSPYAAVRMRFTS